MSDLKADLEVDYGIRMDQNQQENIVNVMTNEFPAGASKATYADCVLLERSMNKDGEYQASDSFVDMLTNEEFYEILKELVEFGISRYERDFSSRYKNTDLVLYQKYTYEDVCRILNWENNEVPLNIGGYKFETKR